jgi:PadR family transcriptional regulator, regulatory protein PadR
MPRRPSASLDADLLQGTLDLLVLPTLQAGPTHGHAIAHVIQHRSDARLQVQDGSRYPALHRLGHLGEQSKGRYYRLTPVGKQQFEARSSRWHELAAAVNRVLRPITN